MFAEVRPWEARLTGSDEHAPCPGAFLVRLGARCTSGAGDVETLQRAATLSAELARTRDTTPAAHRMWASALLDLGAGPSMREPLDRAIARLDEALALDTANAAIASDLAVAHLARAGATGHAQDVFVALDRIERAFAFDSASAIVLFNRGLVLEKLGLTLQALTAWDSYVARDGSSGWTEEVTVRRSRLATRPAAFPDRSQRSPSGFDWRAAVSRDPQIAREYALTALLPEWARASLAADTALAANALRDVGLLGVALASIAGDSSIVHVARECAVTRGAIADAVLGFARGVARFDSARFDGAAPLLDKSHADFTRLGAPSLADWVQLQRAAIEIYEGQLGDADRSYVGVIARSRERRDRSMEARAHWGLALSLSRRGALDASDREFQTAADLFHALGERANHSATTSQVAEVAHARGLERHALDLQFDAQTRHGALAHSRITFGNLIAIGEQLTSTSLPFAAATVFREAVAIARATGRDKDAPEALLHLANALVAAGKHTEADQHLTTARSQVASLNDALMRDRLTADIAMARSSLLERAKPELALSLLDEAERYFRHQEYEFERSPLLVRRAGVRLAVGDTVAAEGDLAAALEMVELLASRTLDGVSSRELLETRGTAFRRLAAIALVRGDTLRALDLTERARGVTTPRVQGAPARGSVVLSYLVLPDETLLWVERPGGGTMLRLSIRERELADLVFRFERLLRGGADREAAHAVGQRLYAMLVDPAIPHLQGGDEIAIVPDGVLDHLPFGALRDERSYLVQRFTVRYAGSLASGRRWVADARVSPDRERAVVVADPAYDATRFAGLETLRFADREATTIDSLYQEATVVGGADATRSRVLSELSANAVFHFAGHAQLTAGDPEKSHLVLASRSTEFGDHVLYAREIARLPLSHVRLVVLSSCGTSQPTLSGRSAARGLAQSFLDAGVDAVVASQWEADDAETARLMSEFHRALKRGASGAAALRASQLQMLDDSTVSLGTWTAFRYEQR